MPHIPYLPYIPYFPNMPYQTDHTHHTYPTNHTTPPPHHRGGGGQYHIPTTPRGGRFDTRAVYGTHSIGGEGGWQGLVHILYSICIVIYTARSVAANSSACSIDMSLRNDQKADYRRQLQQLSKAQTVLHSRTDRSPDSPEMSDSGSSFRNDASF